jgi:hypothetical protein
LLRVTVTARPLAAGRWFRADWRQAAR